MLIQGRYLTKYVVLSTRALFKLKIATENQKIILILMQFVKLVEVSTRILQEIVSNENLIFTKKIRNDFL